MILSPLGALLLQEFNITTAQFGLVVSAYAFSAGASGLLAAGFADKFDRKHLLLFFYAGFVTGTVLCGIANSYYFLLGARIVTGLFGGVLGSISFAIITDLFPMQVRGRVMGIVMTAFAASQVLGIPIGLYFSNHFGWQAPFWMIAGVSAAVGILILYGLRPIQAHLEGRMHKHPFAHLGATISTPKYIYAFCSTALLATGGFMLMPFGSAFSVHNLGIPLEQLPIVYVATGTTSIAAGPIMGRLSDSIGKYRVFCIGSAMTAVMVLIYTHLGLTPLAEVIAISSVMFVGISARMISSSALMSGVPALKDRGAFMAINSSLQQLSGGLASLAAGLIVVQTPGGKLGRYPELGYVVVAATAFTVMMLFKIHRDQRRAQEEVVRD
jgi:predicted MFS family arabinose efflux permease